MRTYFSILAFLIYNISFSQNDASKNLQFRYRVAIVANLLPDTYDPSLLMAGIKINNPDITLSEALEILSSPYGSSKKIY